MCFPGPSKRRVKIPTLLKPIVWFANTIGTFGGEPISGRVPQKDRCAACLTSLPKANFRLGRGIHGIRGAGSNIPPSSYFENRYQIVGIANRISGLEFHGWVNEVIVLEFAILYS